VSGTACTLSAPAWGAPSDSILRRFAGPVQLQVFFFFRVVFRFAAAGLGDGEGDAALTTGEAVTADEADASPGGGVGLPAGVGVGPAGGLGDTGAVGTSVDPGASGDASFAASGNGAWWMTPESMVCPVRLMAWKYMSIPSISTSMNE